MRSVSNALLTVLDGDNRQPDYRIYAWDPALVTISGIVQAHHNHASGIPDPLDQIGRASCRERV